MNSQVFKAKIVSNYKFPLKEGFWPRSDTMVWLLMNMMIVVIKSSRSWLRKINKRFKRRR